MTDLVAFLLARIDEDEQVASAATPGPWRWADEDTLQSATSVSGCVSPMGWYDRRVDEPVPAGSETEWPTGVLAAVDRDDGDGLLAIEPRDAAHIARHHPARVLADCAAKWEIVQRCGQVINLCENYRSGIPIVDRDAALATLRLLAQPYSDHPDFNPEWQR